MSFQKQDNYQEENQPPDMTPSYREEQALETGENIEEELSETSVPPRFKFTWQIAEGFLGWFLVNGLIWLTVTGGTTLSEYEILDRLCFVFPANLVLLLGLLFVKKTRQIALGILVALGLNFFVSFVLGSFYNSFCMIPFFFESP